MLNPAIGIFSAFGDVPVGFERATVDFAGLFDSLHDFHRRIPAIHQHRAERDVLNIQNGVPHL